EEPLPSIPARRPALVPACHKQRAIRHMARLVSLLRRQDALPTRPRPRPRPDHGLLSRKRRRALQQETAHGTTSLEQLGHDASHVVPATNGLSSSRHIPPVCPTHCNSRSLIPTSTRITA